MAYQFPIKIILPPDEHDYYIGYLYPTARPSSTQSWYNTNLGDLPPNKGITLQQSVEYMNNHLDELGEKVDETHTWKCVLTNETRSCPIFKISKELSDNTYETSYLVLTTLPSSGRTNDSEAIIKAQFRKDEEGYYLLFVLGIESHTCSFWGGGQYINGYQLDIKDIVKDWNFDHLCHEVCPYKLGPDDNRISGYLLYYNDDDELWRPLESENESNYFKPTMKIVDGEIPYSSAIEFLCVQYNNYYQGYTSNDYKEAYDSPSRSYIYYITWRMRWTKTNQSHTFYDKPASDKNRKVVKPWFIIMSPDSTYNVYGGLGYSTYYVQDGAVKVYSAYVYEVMGNISGTSWQSGTLAYLPSDFDMYDYHTWSFKFEGNCDVTEIWVDGKLLCKGKIGWGGRVPWRGLFNAGNLGMQKGGRFQSVVLDWAIDSTRLITNPFLYYAPDVIEQQNRNRLLGWCKRNYSGSYGCRPEAGVFDYLVDAEKLIRAVRVPFVSAKQVHEYIKRTKLKPGSFLKDCGVPLISFQGETGNHEWILNALDIHKYYSPTELCDFLEQYDGSLDIRDDGVYLLVDEDYTIIDECIKVLNPEHKHLSLFFKYSEYTPNFKFHNENLCWCGFSGYTRSVENSYEPLSSKKPIVYYILSDEWNADDTRIYAFTTGGRTDYNYVDSDGKGLLQYTTEWGSMQLKTAQWRSLYGTWDYIQFIDEGNNLQTQDIDLNYLFKNYNGHLIEIAPNDDHTSVRDMGVYS